MISTPLYFGITPVSPAATLMSN